MRSKLGAVAGRVDRLAATVGARLANCGRGEHVGQVRFVMLKAGDSPDRNWPAPDVERVCQCGELIKHTTIIIRCQEGAELAS